MKQIIVLLGMIVLGTYLVNVVTLGAPDSFKSDAATLGSTAKTKITTFTTNLSY